MVIKEIKIAAANKTGDIENLKIGGTKKNKNKKIKTANEIKVEDFSS